MSIKEVQETEKIGVPLANWLPEIAITLKTLWPDSEPDLAAILPPLPTLADWLTLLHLSEINSDKVLEHLSGILQAPKSGSELQNSWFILTKLFALTFEAVRRSGQPMVFPDRLLLSYGSWPGATSQRECCLRLPYAIHIDGKDSAFPQTFRCSNQDGDHGHPVCLHIERNGSENSDQRSPQASHLVSLYGHITDR